MRLVNARLCLDCEEVHGDQHCPVCSSESFAFLTRWVTPTDATTPESAPRPARPADPVDRREQVDAYKQILNPTPPRRGRMVAHGALGLAILGLARMLWSASPDAKPQARSDDSPDLAKPADQRR